MVARESTVATQSCGIFVRENPEKQVKGGKKHAGLEAFLKNKPVKALFWREVAT
jgi:hypothetical protein